METKNHPCDGFFGSCHHDGKLCSNRRKHTRHDWVTDALDVFHCRGRSFERRRCSYGEGSNRRCLLKVGHQGDHDEPCGASGAHGPHVKESGMGRPTFDAKGHPYLCKGHSFDYT